MNLAKVRVAHALAVLSGTLCLPVTGGELTVPSSSARKEARRETTAVTDPMAKAYRQGLLAESVSPSGVLGLDPGGIPRLCGVGITGQGNAAPEATAVPAGAVPAGMRSWEPVPGIIRNDGIESFRLEVDANGPVSRVVWQGEPYYFQFLSGTSAPHELRDDGLNGDRVAGDYIFTSEPLRFNTNIIMPAFLYRDSNNPPGLLLDEICGPLEIVELNGQTNRFLSYPEAGVLDSRIPLIEAASLSSNITVASHLVNIKTSSRETQKSIRYANSLQNLTGPIYRVLPDAFDFLMFFSTDHLDFVSTYDYRNFIAGSHYFSKINYSGTGYPQIDYSAAYSSAGKLLGLNIIEGYRVGIYTEIITHELMHQWVAFMSTALGLSDGTGHYDGHCDAASLVGGGNWLDNGNGSFTQTCEFRRQVPPLDKYMMGLISGASVPPLKLSSSVVPCGSLITNVSRTVKIGDIQAIHGVRTPGPTSAQRDFSMGFVAETHGRFLTPAEVTFYDILAERYTKPIPPQAPDPDVSSTWVSITRYFGEGTTWRSDVLSLIQPKLTSIQLLLGGRAQITATGYPGRTYSLQSSTNLSSWARITSQAATTSGMLLFVPSNTVGLASRFYRLTTP